MKNFLMILLFFASTSVYAQKVTITGTVTDEKGESLPGATVQVKGTSQGVLTDFNGKYSLEVVSVNPTLVFSFVGYSSKELEAGSQTTVNVMLSPDTRTLDEVVVVGYGTQKKLNLTAAVDQVSGEALENRAVTNVTQGLQGVMPNLNIRLLDGKPTAAPS
jgi:hypothetical protein